MHLRFPQIPMKTQAARHSSAAPEHTTAATQKSKTVVAATRLTKQMERYILCFVIIFKIGSKEHRVPPAPTKCGKLGPGNIDSEECTISESSYASLFLPTSFSTSSTRSCLRTVTEADTCCSANYVCNPLILDRSLCKWL
eukprot:gnl/MRDRNA2_/MRDRNA2_292038_c0_seq1.p1 gnl/MRDRNA2_/MRDRNA2_292038_c0~~gnl/MRDRNA2_/MRDRNA2_292038_c0_seq1.p1  ORF type:complete len:140 (-),score=14.11 gnl/MRDRNA2_/MRDRNA2_292038_c0_seq1:9-428(-)